MEMSILDDYCLLFDYRAYYCVWPWWSLLPRASQRALPTRALAAANAEAQVNAALKAWCHGILIKRTNLANACLIWRRTRCAGTGLWLAAVVAKASSASLIQVIIRKLSSSPTRSQSTWALAPRVCSRSHDAVSRRLHNPPNKSHF